MDSPLNEKDRPLINKKAANKLLYNTDSIKYYVNIDFTSLHFSLKSSDCI